MIEDNDRNNEDSSESNSVSIESIIAFQRRMQADPDAVSDEEIRAEYGDDISPTELRELFRKTTFGREPKNPRTSARAKLRRRVIWLSRSLDEVESAVAEVRNAPGRTNKQNELDELLDAIIAFRSAVNLPTPSQPSDIDIDPDLFERMFGTVVDAQFSGSASQKERED